MNQQENVEKRNISVVKLVLEFLDSKLLPTYGFAPMGQLRRFGLTFNEINTSRTRRLLYPSGER